VLGFLGSCPWTLGLLLFCGAWGFITLSTYLLPMIWANVRGVQNLKKKYKADWALVTGGSSGIGRSLAEALARQGLNIVLVGLDDALLKDAHEKMRAAFPELEVRKVGCDLTRADGGYMKAIAAATDDVHISLLFNNAGFIVTGFFHDSPIGKQMANIQCNAVAGARITHHFLPKMYASGRPGLVCFTSSAAAYIPSPFTALYSATKAFISRFATSLAAEAGPQGVDVLAVHPSPVRSNFLEGTAKLDMIDNFYKFSTGPDAVVPQIFRKVGRGQVLADLGPVGLVMRLLTKLLDDNFFASAFAVFAGLMPDYAKHAGPAGMTGHLRKKK